LTLRRGLSAAALERVRETIAPGGRILRYRPLRGGISSSVHLVTVETAHGKRAAVVVRRYGEYWQRVNPASCANEFKLLGVLTRAGFPAPKPLLLDDDVSNVFGAPTVLMTRLQGRPVLSPANMTDYLKQLAETLARLHALPTAELEFLADQRAMVDRSLGVPLETDDPLRKAVHAAAVAEWPRVAASKQRRVLCHGDYWPGNVLWSRGRLSGVVDWEQPRLGDPAKDVATLRGDLTILFGPGPGDEFVAHYEAASGHAVCDLHFWDLLISTWAVAEIAAWVAVYPAMGRIDVPVELGRERIRAFARRALHRC
jgi:aminoglycoside phosphotransferase (APT) family kinase protein